MKESDLITRTYEMLERGASMMQAKFIMIISIPYSVKRPIIKYYLDW